MNPNEHIANLASNYCQRCVSFGRHWTKRAGAWPCPVLDHLQSLAFQAQPLPDPLCSCFIERPLSLHCCYPESINPTP